MACTNAVGTKKVGHVPWRPGSASALCCSLPSWSTEPPCSTCGAFDPTASPTQIRGPTHRLCGLLRAIKPICPARLSACSPAPRCCMHACSGCPAHPPGKPWQAPHHSASQSRAAACMRRGPLQAGKAGSTCQPDAGTACRGASSGTGLNNAPICPGWLPGHAMHASSGLRSAGAVLGKVSSASAF